MYSALGYAVYPASPYSQAHHSDLGELPRGRGGFKQATTDRAQIAAWGPTWDGPNTNIGIATGSASRLVVIDVDIQPRPIEAPGGSVVFGEVAAPDTSAADRVRKWAADRGVLLPGSAQVRTPSGGLHIWLRIPEHWIGFEVPRRLRWLEDVDLLWDRHSIKAPPSVKMASERKPGGAYIFEHGCPCQVPVADDSLIRALYETPAEGHEPRSGAGGTGWAGATGGVCAGGTRLDIETPQTVGVPSGKQNETFHRMACSFASTGRPPSEALKALCKAADASQQSPNDPWTLDDLTGLVERAYCFIAEDRGGLEALARNIRF